MDEWWQGDPRAARRCIFGDSGTPAWSGGLLYRLVEGADGSSAPRRDPPALILQSTRRRGSTGYLTQRMIP